MNNFEDKVICDHTGKCANSFTDYVTGQCGGSSPHYRSAECEECPVHAFAKCIPVDDFIDNVIKEVENLLTNKEHFTIDIIITQSIAKLRIVDRILKGEI